MATSWDQWWNNFGSWDWSRGLPSGIDLGSGTFLGADEVYNNFNPGTTTPRPPTLVESIGSGINAIGENVIDPLFNSSTDFVMPPNEYAQSFTNINPYSVDYQNYFSGNNSLYNTALGSGANPNLPTDIMQAQNVGNYNTQYTPASAPQYNPYQTTQYNPSFNENNFIQQTTGYNPTQYDPEAYLNQFINNQYGNIMDLAMNETSPIQQAINANTQSQIDEAREKISSQFGSRNALFSSGYEDRVGQAIGDAISRGQSDYLQTLLGATTPLAQQALSQGAAGQQYAAGLGSQEQQYMSNLLAQQSQFGANLTNQQQQFLSSLSQADQQYLSDLMTQQQQYNAGLAEQQAQYGAGLQSAEGMANQQNAINQNQYNTDAAIQQQQFLAQMQQQAMAQQQANAQALMNMQLQAGSPYYVSPEMITTPSGWENVVNPTLDTLAQFLPLLMGV